MHFRLHIIDKWLVGISFMILLLSPLFLFLDERTQLMMCTTLLLITGIPHGALDHIIFFKLVKNRKKRLTLTSLTRFIAMYMLSFLAFLLLWIVSPAFTLIVFLFISAYHFGESQLFYLSGGKHHPSKALYFFWGAFILTMYIAIHQDYAVRLMESAVGFDIELSPVFITFTLLFFGFGWLGQMLFMVMRKDLSWQSIGNELLVVGVIFLIFVCLPPLFSFMVYFGLWHALKVFYAEYILLHKEREVNNIRQVIMASLPFTILAIIGLILFITINHILQLGVNPVMMVIIGISAMTLPHAAIMQKMYQRHLS